MFKDSYSKTVPFMRQSGKILEAGQTTHNNMAHANSMLQINTQNM